LKCGGGRKGDKSFQSEKAQIGIGKALRAKKQIKKQKVYTLKKKNFERKGHSVLREKQRRAATLNFKMARGKKNRKNCTQTSDQRISGKEGLDMVCPERTENS